MILYQCDQDMQCSKNGKDKVGPRLTIKFEITSSLPYLCQAGTDF